MIYGYCRVSTDDQSISLDNQRQELQAYAVKHGLTIDQVFCDEDVSGKIPMKDRPQGRIMWDTLRTGDLVVVTKLDRGWRSTADAANTLATWKQYGVRLAILDFPIDTSTDEGEMMFTQFASWAQYERKRIGRRVSDAVQYLKRNGLPYACARPFGWMRGNKEWVVCEKERKIADKIMQWRADGWGWEKITLALARDGVKKPVLMRKDARGYYSPSDVWLLAHAASAGYPKTAPTVFAAELRSGKQRATVHRGRLKEFAMLPRT